MHKFRKIRGMNLPYREQGLIWFTCMNYALQPPQVQGKINQLCREVGGDYVDALFAMLTRENVSVPWIEQTYHVSDSVLYERRRKFYEKFAGEIKRRAADLPSLRERISSD